jgi:hypothetical protein
VPQQHVAPRFGGSFVNIYSKANYIYRYSFSRGLYLNHAGRYHTKTHNQTKNQYRPSLFAFNEQLAVF